MTLSITMLCQYAECPILFSIMLSVIVLSVIEKTFNKKLF